MSYCTFPIRVKLWEIGRRRRESDSVPGTLRLSVGMGVIWQADATHYVDEIRVNPL